MNSVGLWALFVALICCVEAHSRHRRLPESGVPTGHVYVQGGDEIVARLGVPYAQPPARFVRATPSNGSWIEAPLNVRPKECIQALAGLFGYDIDEDCLYINVYGPKNARGKRLPVLVYLHGGAFKFGSANEFSPEQMGYAASAGFVVVSLQYRVSTLGFFAPPKTTKFVPNLALYDIVLALEFVRDNIHLFGGNPNQVTVLGQSAGACAAHALSISDAVDASLFDRVILMSGVASICFEGTFGSHNPTFLAAETICGMNLYEAYDEEKLFECMKSASAEAISHVDEKNPKNWAMVVDGHFFNAHPLTMARKNRGHEYLIGAVEDEWAFFENLFSIQTGLTLYSSKSFRQSLESFAAITDAKQQDFLEALYFKNDSLVDSRVQYFDAQVDSITDLVFHVPITAEASLLAEVSPVHLYEFNVKNARKSTNGRNHAQHSDDLAYVFGPQTTVDSYRVFRDTLYDFALTGRFPTAIPEGTTQKSLLFNKRNPPTHVVTGFCQRAFAVSTQFKEHFHQSLAAPRKG